MEQKNPFLNPYLGGFLLGLILLAAFFFAGQGLGASGTFSRITAMVEHWIAPETAEANAYFGKYFKGTKHILNNWLAVLALGVLIGGAVSGFLGKRNKTEIVSGPNISTNGRLVLALLGGIITGVATRISFGCTSGQALSGGAVLSVGGWIFMFSVFAGGYAVAYFFRKEWI